MSLEQSCYAHGSGAMGCVDIPQEMGGLPRTGGDRKTPEGYIRAGTAVGVAEGTTRDAR